MVCRKTWQLATATSKPVPIRLRSPRRRRDARPATLMRVCWRRYEQSPSSANSVAQVKKNQGKREALLFERLTPRAPRVAVFFVLFCFARRTSPKGGTVRGLLLAGNFLRFSNKPPWYGERLKMSSKRHNTFEKRV